MSFLPSSPGHGDWMRTPRLGIYQYICMFTHGFLTSFPQHRPSPSAQASLIRECYARAGLDPSYPDQRPQFFEAHGTGTPAGDPVEAEAIATAFFPDRAAGSREKLYVGSIKTVIGHTEGTAGLAALLKASLAIQNGIIPPNMHFNRLNPKVAPFYSNLEVPTAAVPWPSSGSGIRRASINRSVSPPASDKLEIFLSKLKLALASVVRTAMPF